MSLRAVLFDVDFTLAKPGPDLGPEGYRRLGERHGLDLDPGRYPEARAAAIESLERDPELRHDEELWFAFTERIIRGMGGDTDAARDLAVEMTRLWERSENFDLYDDVLPVIGELRARGLKLGLVSNSGRELDDFVTHHRLDVDCAVTSRAHGWTKPHPTIFQAALELLGVDPAEAAMVGDSVEEDVEGARALGMRAFLIDRENRYPEAPGTPQASRSSGRAAPALPATLPAWTLQASRSSGRAAPAWPATLPAWERLRDLWALPAALEL